MEKVQPVQKRQGFILGFFLVIIGLIWLLREMNIGLPWWIFTWQMLLIGIGLAIGLRSNFKERSSYILIGLGTGFLLNDVFDWHFSLREYFWPILLMAVGLMIMLSRGKKNLNRNYSSGTGAFSEDNFEITSIFTASRRNIISSDFNRGTVTAVFGGADIKLGEANFQNEAVIDVNAVFGGIEIWVPSDWRVEIHANAILGAIEDKRFNNNIDHSKVLRITGFVMFAGVEIKCL